MKLTILYDKEDIKYLLEFSVISEENLIEYSGHHVERDWEPAPDSQFSEILTVSDNLLLICSGKSFTNKWVAYALGYASGKNLNVHLYSVDNDIPEWTRAYGISSTIEDLASYYKRYNQIWLERASVKIARKYLTDFNRDITLTAFVEVVQEGDCLLAGVYLDAGFKSTDCDKNGVPLICWAARKRKLSMIKLLMQAGADINAVSGDRDDTALIDAVSEDDYEIVSFILKYNPDLEKKSKNGQTALIIASGHNNTEIVGLLMEQGANISTTDKLGMSAVSYAKMQQNETILSLLSVKE
ncbi:MAG: ankyrin repeat domain-containing protein [Spirochaetaceae bacterium]|nr:ankyrin repeat domain-containing protein [Spirochaetaceae bacterium]